MARLTILTGARRGQRFDLPPGIVTIGRQVGNTLVVADESVANQHLLLSVDHEGCRVKDRSGGGTAVNGVLGTGASGVNLATGGSGGAGGPVVLPQGLGVGGR